MNSRKWSVERGPLGGGVAPRRIILNKCVEKEPLALRWIKPPALDGCLARRRWPRRSEKRLAKQVDTGFLRMRTFWGLHWNCCGSHLSVVSAEHHPHMVSPGIQGYGRAEGLEKHSICWVNERIIWVTFDFTIWWFFFQFHYKYWEIRNWITPSDGVVLIGKTRIYSILKTEIEELFSLSPLLHLFLYYPDVEHSRYLLWNSSRALKRCFQLEKQKQFLTFCWLPKLISCKSSLAMYF